MIQEYLFVTGESRAEIQSLEVTDKIIKEITQIENSTCWTLRLKIDSESEDAAKSLDPINTKICEKYKPIVLSNGSSAYFNKSLFPIVNEFERKLRKLLYLASSIQGDKTSNQVINDLESKDLGEIFQALFADEDFVKKVKETINKKSWIFTRNEALQTIEKIDENILWDKLLGETYVTTLRSNFADIRKNRNDVMHAHNINLSQYKEAKKLFKKVNEELDIAIGNLVGTKTENKQIASSNFNDTLGSALKALQNQIDWEQTFMMPEAIKEIAKSYLEINSKLTENLPEVSKSLLATYTQNPDYIEAVSNISEVMKDICPATEALKKISDQMPTYKIAVPPEVTKLHVEENIQQLT